MFRLLFTVSTALLILSPSLRADSNDSQTLHSADGQYQLVIPKGWESHDFHLDNVQIGAINNHRGEYAELIAENTQDYTDSLKQYADAKRDTMAMSLDNPRLVSSEELQINGHDAIRFEIHGELPNSETPVGYLVTVTKTKTHYIQVIGWTLESHFNENHDELAGLANGFSENAGTQK